MKTPTDTGKEFAPGIPVARKTHGIPPVKNKTWTMAVQEHNARRAGKHWDLRLVDPTTGFAHSWAVPKNRFPVPGERPLLAVQTPTHTAHYALNFGEGKPKTIGKGYGSGDVFIKHKEPIKVLSAGSDRVKFQRNNRERIMLFRTKNDKWLMRSLRKEGSDMSPYLQGRLDALQKFGVAPPREKRTSVGDSQLPLETEDADSPVGLLSAALGKLPSPQGGNNRGIDSDSGSVEERLNRPTSWSSPFTIPLDAAQGPSPVWPGFGI